MKIKIYFSSFYIISISIFLIFHFPFSYENSITIKVHPENEGNINLINKFDRYSCPYKIEDGNGNTHGDEDKCTPYLYQQDYKLTFYWNNDDLLVDLTSMFEGKTAITEVILNLTPDNIKYMGSMFKGCTNLRSVKLPYINHDKIMNLEFLFQNCVSLTTVEFNYNTFNTVKVANMQGMFQGCSSLVSIQFPNNFRTTNCLNTADMFSGCKSLISIDFKIFETSNMGNMACVFRECEKIASFNLYSFDTSKVSLMQYMFADCNNINSLDLSRFNTQTLTTADNMFQNLKLKEIDLSNFNWNKVASMNEMFISNSQLELVKFGDSEIKHNVKVTNIFKNCNKRMIIYINKINPEILFDSYESNFTIAECGSLSKELILSKFKGNKIVCIDNCKNLLYYKFKYEDKCYKSCPQGTIANNHICEKKNSTNEVTTTDKITITNVITEKNKNEDSTNKIDDTEDEKTSNNLIQTEKIEDTINDNKYDYETEKIKDEIINETILCDTNIFFTGKCQNIFQTLEDKKNFSENIINSSSGFKLYSDFIKFSHEPK